MDVGNPDPYLLFQSLPSSVDLYITDVPLVDKESRQPIGATAHLVITTYGYVYSEFSPDDPSKILDYYWFGHQCALDHPPVPGVGGLDSFGLTVAQIPYAGSPSDLPPAPSGIDITDANAVAAALNIPAANLQVPQGSVLKSDPQAVGTTESYTSSMSQTIGANAGAFGDTPTGGVSESETASNSVETNVPPVEIWNLTQGSYASWSWEPQGDPYMSSFQPYAQVILMSSDDGLGTRATKLAGANPETDRYTAVALLAGFSYETGDSAAVAAVQHLFKIPLPPPPKPPLKAD